MKCSPKQAMQKQMKILPSFECLCKRITLGTQVSRLTDEQMSHVGASINPRGRKMLNRYIQQCRVNKRGICLTKNHVCIQPKRCVAPSHHLLHPKAAYAFPYFHKFTITSRSQILGPQNQPLVTISTINNHPSQKDNPRFRVRRARTSRTTCSGR